MIFQHHRFQIWSQVQHPYKHSLAEMSYTNPALPTNEPQNAEAAMNWLFSVIYPQTQASVATPAALPAAGNTINDYRVVLDDGDGKAASYRWEQREGDVAAKWYKIYDMDWGESSILSNFLIKTQDVYVYKYGIDDLDDTGVALAGDDAGQSVYGGQTANTHLTLYANSGDGVGVGTGYVQMGDNSRPKVDDTYTSGTATYRWSHIYTVLATVGTMSIAGGSITDSSGAISFGDENLSTTGTVAVGTMLLAAGSITDSSGAISFGDENLTTTGRVTANDVVALGAASQFASGTTVGDLTLASGSITDSSGAISFGDENLSTTGRIDVDDIRLDGNTISITTLDTDLALVANGTGVVDVQSAMTTIGQTVTGTVDITGQLDVDNLRMNGNTISSTNTDGNIDLDPDGNGLVRTASSIHPTVDSSFDLGVGGAVWNDLYLDGAISDGTTSISSATLQSFRDANVGVGAGMSLFWSGTQWLPSDPDSEIDHGTISGLSDDDHTQYALLAGRAGGQTLIGGTAASDNLTLESTSDGTKGSVIFSDVLRPGADATVDIGTASFRVNDLFMAGEGIGFRIENSADFASLPAPSAGSKGRIAWVDNINTIYVDDGGVWVAAAAAATGAGVWAKYSLSYTDFSVAAGSNDIELFSLPSLDVVEAILIKHSTAFSGGGAASYTLSVGVSGDLDEFAIPFDTFQAVGDTVFDLSNVVDYVSAAVTSIRINAASDVNLDQLTAGDVEVYVRTSSIPS
jgi:hypothetical protein